MSDQKRAVIWHKANQEARHLAKAAGAAQRIAEGVNNLARLAGDLPSIIAFQVNALVEEFDLLRFHLREATLRGVIEPPDPKPGETVEEHYQRVVVRPRAALQAARKARTTETTAKAQAPRSKLQAPAKAKRKGKRR